MERGRGRGKKHRGEEDLSREPSETWPWAAVMAAAAAHGRCTAPLRAIVRKTEFSPSHTHLCYLASSSLSLLLLPHIHWFWGLDTYLMSSFTEPHTVYVLYVSYPHTRCLLDCARQTAYSIMASRSRCDHIEF